MSDKNMQGGRTTIHGFLFDISTEELSKLLRAQANQAAGIAEKLEVRASKVRANEKDIRALAGTQMGLHVPSRAAQLKQQAAWYRKIAEGAMLLADHLIPDVNYRLDVSQLSQLSGNIRGGGEFGMQPLLAGVDVDLDEEDVP